MDIRTTLFCSLLAVGTVAHAEGFYIDGSVGQTHTRLKDLSHADLDTFVITQYGFTVQSTSLDESDTGYKLQAGYQFGPNFALEGGYVDLGKVEYKYLANSFRGTMSYKTNGWNLDGVLILPVNAGISVFGKLGVIRAETKFHDTYLDSSKHTKIAPALGAGIAWNFWAGMSVRAEWNRYINLNKKEVDYDNIGFIVRSDSRLNVDLFSVGLSYQF